MTTLTGIPLSPGAARGKALKVKPARFPRTSGLDPAASRTRLAEARQAARAELIGRVDALAEGPGREILRAHLTLLGDPALLAEIDAGVNLHLGPQECLDRAAAVLAARISALRDPVLQSRAADVRDVCECIARHLSGTGLIEADAEARVVCAAELSPAQVLQLIDRRPLAFVLETAVETSHAAILMRALGVPAVIGVPDLTELVDEGDAIAVDAVSGRVFINPPATTALVEQGFAAPAPPDHDAEPARTVDGTLVAVTATVIDAPGTRRAIQAGADGIGLFRTESLFLSSHTLPSEQLQYETYCEVSHAADGRLVTMRTIDLGGDKRPPALPLPVEPNPALGLRGVRLALAHPDLARIQLRALFRAFAGRRLCVLVPMVNDVGDVARMRELMTECGSAGAQVELGVMIETPAAALMADELAAAADFLSLGTNDLTQYVLAVDRDHPPVAALYQPLHPAVLRLVHGVTTAAGRRGRRVTACGEAAAEPVAARVLVGMGVTELTVPAAMIGRSKRLVRQISMSEARSLADDLMMLPTAAAVMDVLASHDAR